MPGMKHMNQDRPVDGQDTLQTMQDKKSGIYQDRTAGKLPQGRVAQHYQDMDAQVIELLMVLNQLLMKLLILTKMEIQFLMTKTRMEIWLLGV